MFDMAGCLLRARNSAIRPACIQEKEQNHPILVFGQLYNFSNGKQAMAGGICSAGLA
jgi:hypothetical protein